MIKKLFIFIFLVISVESKFLLTQLYNELKPEREIELLTCLERNIQSGFFDQIHIFYDGVKDRPDCHNTLDRIYQFIAHNNADDDVFIHPVNGRISYQQMFYFSSETFSAGQVVVLANADIFFDPTINLADDINEDTLYALGRYEPIDGTLNGEWKLSPVAHSSQDVWIFRNPIMVHPDQPANQPVVLGVWGCDGTIARQAATQGFIVLNPCISIKTYHWHKSAIRNYTPKDTIGNESTWLYLPPCELSN